jgi:hypothetical protein
VSFEFDLSKHQFFRNSVFFFDFYCCRLFINYQYVCFFSLIWSWSSPTEGIATTAGFSPTSENIDRKLALHYFSRAALALEFAPRLAQSTEGRVLSVLSAGVHSPYAEYDTDFDLSKDFTLSKAANASGFYNDIFVEKLHSEFPTLTVSHAAPGFVASRWGSDLPFYMRWPTRAIQVFATSIEECGELLGASFFRPAPFKGQWHLMDQQRTRCGPRPRR